MMMAEIENHQIVATQNNATIWFSLKYPFWQYWFDVQDPRTATWPLVRSSPYPVLALLSFYLYFSLYLGPRYMRNRPPIGNLKWPMLIYNFTMALVNFYFFLASISYSNYGARFFNFTYPDTNDRSPQTLVELNIAWGYFISKWFDLLDTVFFVLRKKDQHISFLHLYHHTAVPILGYLVLKHNALIPGGLFFGLLNSSIHALMYSYYGLCLLGPGVRPYLTWKRYITQLQIGQFVLIIAYYILTLFKQQGYPMFWLWVGTTQPVLFIVMFYKFYQKTYPGGKLQKDK